MTSLRGGAGRVLVVLAVVTGVVAAGPAVAAGPVHLKDSGTFGPDVLPAGTVCDFTYKIEGSFTFNRKLFFDAQGNLVRAESQNRDTITHTNLDTGRSLTETVNYAAHSDFVKGERTITGQTWHLRDVDGRLVVHGAGLVGIDLATFDIVRFTPNTKAEFAPTICPALGGAPA